MALYSLKRGVLAHNIKLNFFENFSKTEIVNQFTQKRQKQKLETDIFHLKEKFLYNYLKKISHTIADQKTSVSFFCEVVLFHILWYFFVYLTSPCFHLLEDFVLLVIIFSLFVFLRFRKILAMFMRFFWNHFFAFSIISGWRVFRNVCILQ